MSQVWADNCFDEDHEGQVDLQAIEDNFATLKSLFSGSTAPSSPVAGMPWFDSGQKVMKVRDAGNANWVGLMHGDTSQKMWVYRNAAPDGWVVDGTLTDRILAIKGGTTYTTGAAPAGNWTITPPTINISHNLTVNTYHRHSPGELLGGGGGFGQAEPSNLSDYQGSSNALSGSISANSSFSGDYRPAAAVGTLQRLDL